jgi:UTP--glucose-1-phosphate uridylyltransferase
VKFRQAVIPMASPQHRDLPFQQVLDGEGRVKHLISLQIEELLASGIERILLITNPHSAGLMDDLLRTYSCVEPIVQPELRGFGHAVLCAEPYIGNDSFILQVCDHLFITYAERSCTSQLIDVAARDDCTVSAVQVTKENELPYFGVIGGRHVRGEEALFVVETVLEKPTPTAAEERCMVPGLRLGTYLSFFGTHALHASAFRCLRELESTLEPGHKLGLSEALGRLAMTEKYLALQVQGHRIDLESPYGLLRAQVALALNGPKRTEVLHVMLEEVAAVTQRPV